MVGKYLGFLILLFNVSCITVQPVDNISGSLQGSWTLSSFYCEDIQLSNRLNQEIKDKKLSIEWYFSQYDFSQKAIQDRKQGRTIFESSGIFVADADTIRFQEQVRGQVLENPVTRLMDLEVEGDQFSLASESLCDGKPGLAIFQKST